jgi:uncharacterized protein GlcG (DUF336 family)
MTIRHEPDMSSWLATELVARVHQDCQELGLSLAAAVVDRGGNVVAAGRMDGAQLGAWSLATDKAFTAVSFGQPTSAWAASSRPEGSDWGLAGTLGGRAVVFPGGVPLFYGGQLLGALGVSGAASTVDEGRALAAAASLGLAVAP